MKKIAYYALHYGKEYLAWSIRSVQDAVDEIVVLYTDRPSFGHDTQLVCPDSEEELKREARRFLTKPLMWIRGHWTGEGQHRDEIVQIARKRGIGQVLAVDADELWCPVALKAAIEVSAARPERNILVRFIHFWRSFKWVCKDPCMPVRIINVESSDGTWYLDPQLQPVLHFGYAQTGNLVGYKESIHGHKAEWREGWFDQKFAEWTPGSGIGDVHPTNGKNFWTPEPADEKIHSLVEDLLSDHPYFELEIIK